MRRLAYFVSSHGFGHAARASAIIDRLLQQDQALQIDLFAGTPDWFFAQSFGDRWPERVILHPWETDVGLVQATALAEDMEATIRRLGDWYPIPEARLNKTADAVEATGAEILVSDISPLGLAAAQTLGLPSVLVENFTWSWIYRGYPSNELESFAQILDPLFDEADLNLRTRPFCGPLGSSSQAVDPVARRPRLDRHTVRRSLDIPEDADVVLVTMGGVPWHFEDLDRHLEARGARDCHLIIAGGADRPTRLGKTWLIPHRSDFYHPDLVQASDAVVGKLGYSTVAEVAQSGCRLGYVPRPVFPESPELEKWVREHMSCVRFEPAQLEDGTWLDGLVDLLAQPLRPALSGGADQAAAHILDFLSQA